MKLLDRYNRLSLLVTILVIIITGIIYYFTISYILTAQVDKDLIVEEHEIFDYVKLNGRLPQVFKSEDLRITFQPVNNKLISRYFIDTTYRDGKNNGQESGRGLISLVKVGRQSYRITIIESKVETEDLIRLIFLITLGIILVLMLLLLIINRRIIRNLWQPFYHILNQVKLFNLADNKTITAQDTAIAEFRDMNQEITAMSLRVRSDYEQLKTFVENASHELMTPIAVMNSKLDTLIQTGSYNEGQSRLLDDLYTSMTRLTRLNQSMLLLARIENQLMGGDETVDLTGIIHDKVEQLKELYQDKGITLTAELCHKQLQASRYLIDVLLNNLLINAIRHNIKQGIINIKLSENELVIKNTGEEKDRSDEEIFKRFSKSASSEGSGLGLTISAQICSNYGYQLLYSYHTLFHYFTVKFF